MPNFIAGSIYDSFLDPFSSSQVVTMPDGGEVTLDWRRKDAGEGAATDAEYSGPIVLFLPGLTGHSQSEYIKSLSNVAHDELVQKHVK